MGYACGAEGEGIPVGRPSVMGERMACGEKKPSERLLRRLQAYAQEAQAEQYVGRQNTRTEPEIILAGAYGSLAWE